MWQSINENPCGIMCMLTITVVVHIFALVSTFYKKK